MPTPELTPVEVEQPEALDESLQAALPAFEHFFKAFGFKRVQGRIWGLLVLSGHPLSSREISTQLSISQGATSAALTDLTEWGAISSEFDSSRRCHLHSAVGNALSIVATVFRRREQVVLQQFKQTSERTLVYVKERYGPRDPRVVTLRSIVTTCDIADALMNLVLSAVDSALGDSQSILSRAVNAAFKVGVGVPARLITGRLPRGAELIVPAPSGSLEDAAREEDAERAEDATRG